MSRWREVTRRELHRYREQTGYSVVERQDLLDQTRPILEQEFPNADTPGQTLSRVLQELRDRDELEFLDSRGRYRILDLNYEAERSAADEPTDHQYEARTYETTVQARSMPAAFREAALEWYDSCCPVSGVDHEGLLDVAHILPWSDHPDHRTDPENVFVLNKTHHAAFDRGLFTLDGDYRLHVAPDLSTESELLRRTLVDRDREQVSVPAGRQPSVGHLRKRNSELDWW